MLKAQIGNDDLSILSRTGRRPFRLNPPDIVDCIISAAVLAEIEHDVTGEPQDGC